jgi:hypothetical protein
MQENMLSKKNINYKKLIEKNIIHKHCISLINIKIPRGEKMNTLIFGKYATLEEHAYIEKDFRNDKVGDKYIESKTSNMNKTEFRGFMQAFIYYMTQTNGWDIGLIKEYLNHEDDQVVMMAVNSIINNSGASKELAIQLLEMPQKAVVNKAVEWVVSLFNFDNDLMRKIANHPEHKVKAFMWVMSEEESIPPHIIRKNGDKINIIYKSTNVNPDEFPGIDQIRGIPFDISMSGRLIIDENFSDKFIVRDVTSINGKEVDSLGERESFMGVISEIYNWDDIDNVIIDYATFADQVKDKK